MRCSVWKSRSGEAIAARSEPDEDDPYVGRPASRTSRGPAQVEKIAAGFMRASETAIREMPITGRTPRQTGQVTGRTVAKDEAHIAFATAANSFFRVTASSLGRDIQIGERVSLRFHQGRASLDNGRSRSR